MRSFEYLDVVETSDGSIWKGVIVEQTPNVQYKIATSDGSLHVIKAADVVRLAKQKNNDWREGPGTAATTTGTTTARTNATTAVAPRDAGVGTDYESGGGGLPAPYAKSGLRIDPETTVVFPQGVLSQAMVNTSYGTGVRVGYEKLFGNIGITGGGMTRVTWWGLPGGTNDMAWTLETDFYARAALHMGRVAPYAGVALGLDTNYQYSAMIDKSNTSLGFGMDLQAGVAIAATPLVAIDLGADFHPGTDTLDSQSPISESASYFAVHLGASIRL